tara:strand:+ start:2908 stop:3093 length:186 start_codon:yes stop_codon:yes gene_type:complete
MANVNQAVQGQAQPVPAAPVAAEPAPKAVDVGGGKKSIWKRWWFWALVVVIIAAIVVFLII